MAEMLGPGVINVSIAIAVIYIPTYFRVVRGHVLSVKEEPYVEAARTLGASHATIIVRYIFPNVIASVAVIFPLNIADAILTEAGLSFLGLGIAPPSPDYGVIQTSGSRVCARAYLSLRRHAAVDIPVKQPTGSNNSGVKRYGEDQDFTGNSIRKKNHPDTGP